MTRQQCLHWPATALLAIFVGCAGAAGGPPTEQLRTTLAETIPAHWHVRSFRVEASENVGSKVEPVFKYRFSALVELREATYQAAGKEAGVLLLNAVAPVGKTVELNGISTATLRGRTWRISHQIYNNVLPEMGRPRSAFGSARTVVKQTPEETAFREEQRLKREAEERALREKLAAQRKRLFEVLSGTSVLHGKYDERDDRAEAVLRLSSFDRHSGRLTGTVEYKYRYNPSAPSEITSVDGVIEGATLRLWETDILQKYNLTDIRDLYDFSLSVSNDMSTLSGTGYSKHVYLAGLRASKTLSFTLKR